MASVSDQNFTFVESNKKVNKILQDSRGFQYRLRDKKGDKVYYKCRGIDRFNCKATGILIRNEVFEPKGEHNHHVERTKLVLAEIVRKNVNNAGQNQEIPQRNIVGKILRDISNTAMSKFAMTQLPTTNSINMKIKRQRRRLSNEPVLPKDIVEDLKEIDDQFSMIDEEQFLIYNEVRIYEIC